MKIFKNKLSLQKEISKDNCLSFVPTMGGLHRGHLSLIKKAKKYKCKICVSIFINPTQFNKKNDYKDYPRNIKSDIKELKKLKVNYLYLPTYTDIYSFKTENKIYIDKFSKQLCGKFRKGHFEGVINVVNRLLEIINPKYIFLGLKDFQQFYLIEAHIKNKRIKTKVISCKTIREINGVACSTRNSNLTKEQFIIASKVYKYLILKKKLIKKNFKKINSLSLKNDLLKLGLDRVDYVQLFNKKTLKNIKKKNENFRIFIAYYIGKIRLIDNI